MAQMVKHLPTMRETQVQSLGWKDLLEKGMATHPSILADPLAKNQAPPSMGFSRQEYWGGLPFPFPGDLSNPGIEPGSPAL